MIVRQFCHSAFPASVLFGCSTVTAADVLSRRQVLDTDSRPISLHEYKGYMPLAFHENNLNVILFYASVAIFADK